MASTSKQASPSKEALNIQALSLEEEDALIHARITNDERPLKRLTKKFHVYTSVAYPPIIEPPPTTTSSVEEAREAFEIELANFKLLLRKSRMVCDAENKQVDIYRKEKQRIVNEHDGLKTQIEDLKSALEQAQIDRRRKIEYDQIAEKINTLPSREQLDHAIAELENDMQVIRVEHEAQNLTILARKNALDSIVSDLSQLRVLGKEVSAKLDTTDSASRAPSEPASPAPMSSTADGAMEVEGEDKASSVETDDKSGDIDVASGSGHLNPAARPFAPRRSTPLLQTATHQLRIQNSASLGSNLGADMGGMADTPSFSREVTPAPPMTPSQTQDTLTQPTTSREPSQPPEALKSDNREEGEEGEEGEEAEDIEMGELSEDKDRSKKAPLEDREEGEASDFSSELSDPPDED